MEQKFCRKRLAMPSLWSSNVAKRKSLCKLKEMQILGISMPNITIPAPYIGDVPNNPYGPYGIPLGGTTGTPPPNFVNTISGVYNAENDNKE